MTTTATPTRRLRLVHSSLQFSDTRAQQAHDTEAVFDYADQRGAVAVTGTEAGEAQLWNLVAGSAEDHGYRVHRYRSNWLAVKRAAIERDTWETGNVFVADNDETVGRGHDPAFPWATFTHTDPAIGRISIAAGHYPTKGRTPADPNYAITVRYAEKLGAWARDKGKGRALAFYGGDQNVPDNLYDTFRGQPLTSAWDEVDTHPGTGHGNIDVLASYDGDGRVRWVDARALNDRRLFLNTDHYLIEATAEVRVLPNTKGPRR